MLYRDRILVSKLLAMLSIVKAVIGYPISFILITCICLIFVVSWLRELCMLYRDRILYAILCNHSSNYLIYLPTFWYIEAKNMAQHETNKEITR